MKIQALSNSEAAASGFTHRAVISAADGDFSAAAGSQTYTLASLVAGHRIKDAALKVVTPVSGGAISAATAVLGKTGTTNAYITSADVFTGTAVKAKAGDGASFNQAGGEAFSAASALILTLATTSANVNAATAGELHVLFSLFQLNDL